MVCDKNENLLVDFGSDDPASDLSAVAAKIQDERRNEANSNEISPLSVLVTHFHKDHINGFLKESLTASVVYLPDILDMSRFGGKINFLQLCILEDIFRCISLNQKLKITLYDLLIKLCDLKSTIVFLKRGCEFSVSGKVYQVLWPSFSDSAIHGRVQNRVLKALIKLGIASSSELDKRTAKSDVKQILSGLQESSDSITELSAADLKEVDNFIGSLLKGYDLAISSQWEELQNYSAELQEKYNKLVEFIDNLKNASEYSTINEKTRKELIELTNSMRKQANKISIVFQSVPEEDVSAILMTGDIPSGEFNKLLNREIASGPQISKQYNIIKAPHHATSTYFTNHLPKCDIILASNGRTHKNHSRWHKISYEYGAFYHSHKGCSMICTNPRCELVDLKDTQNCKNCGTTSMTIGNLSVSVI